MLLGLDFTLRALPPCARGCRFFSVITVQYSRLSHTSCSFFSQPVWMFDLGRVLSCVSTDLQLGRGGKLGHRVSAWKHRPLSFSRPASSCLTCPLTKTVLHNKTNHSQDQTFSFCIGFPTLYFITVVLLAYFFSK